MKRYFKTLPIEVLHSALGYQRPLDEEFIREKSRKENFDPKEIDEPAISKRIINGKEEYRIIDGQHTISIVECVGWKNIRCEIREGLTDAEENEWFFKRNNKRRHQTSGRMLNAKINGKFDSQMNTLVESLKSVGYKIKTSDIKGGKGVINAGSTIENVFNDMNKKDFDKCIKLHSAVFKGDKKSLQSSFLNGFKKFYLVFKDEVDEKEFSKRLIHVFSKKYKANDIMKSVSNNTLKKKTLDFKFAWEFIGFYNDGLTEDKKLKYSKLAD